MAETPPFLREPEDTREAIMRATYLALCEHGYADLTIQRIGDRFEKSKSLLYHHYENKDELLLDFLSFMLDQFEQSVPEADEGGADEHVDAIVDRMLAESVPPERRAFGRAMVELRAQAAHDEAYREQFTRHDEFFETRLAGVVADGVDSGVFRPVDPGRVAAFLVTIIVGVMTRRVTNDRPFVPAVRAELEEYVESTLLAAD